MYLLFTISVYASKNGKSCPVRHVYTWLSHFFVRKISQQVCPAWIVGFSFLPATRNVCDFRHASFPRRQKRSSTKPKPTSKGGLSSSMFLGANSESLGGTTTRMVLAPLD
jgi:hypothetical protein